MEVIKLTFLWIVLTFLFGCSPTKELTETDMYGRYRLKSVHGHGTNISLMADNTFEYNWHGGLISGQTLGRWEIKGKNLILNSHKQPIDSREYVIEPLPPNDTSGYIFHIKGMDSTALGNPLCLLKKDSLILGWENADMGGVCRFDSLADAKNLEVRYIRSVSGIKLTEFNTNVFIVSVNWEKNYYIYFTNTKWKIRGDRIYNPPIRPNRYPFNYYEKVLPE